VLQGARYNRARSPELGLEERRVARQVPQYGRGKGRPKHRDGQRPGLHGTHRKVGHTDLEASVGVHKIGSGRSPLRGKDVTFKAGM
jgi:hypothetical protein